MNTQGKLHERKPKKQEEMKTVLGALRRGGGGGKGLCSGEIHCVSMPFLRQDAQMPRPLAWPTSKNSHNINYLTRRLEESSSVAAWKRKEPRKPETERGGTPVMVERASMSYHSFKGFISRRALP